MLDREHKSKTVWLGLIAVILGLSATTGQAATIHVPGDQPTIQAALDAAANTGDEILVAPGTYPEAINFHGKAVYLHSSAGAAVTTIDATGLSTSVVTCANSEGLGTVLEGFTITGGSGTHDQTGFTYGGGMYNLGSSPTVTNCTFSGNWANDYGIGGGMANSGSGPTLTNCTFSGNSAGWFGGGMANSDSNPTVTNCTFSGNSAGWVGGGMIDGGGNPTVTNCTFNGNWAGGFGGAMDNSSSSPTVTNCILWNNAPNEISRDAATVTYSDVQGGYAGTGNIDADPLFVDSNNGNLRLAAGSPCIDTGDLNFVPTPGETDLDGKRRVWDGNGTGTAIVDMGAYEFGAHRYGDLNCDGVVNFDDIDPFVLALSDPAGYQQQYPHCNGLLADSNGDGVVNFDDIDPFVELLSGG